MQTKRLKVDKEGSGDWAQDMSAVLRYTGSVASKLLVLMIALTSARPQRWTWDRLNKLMGCNYPDGKIREIVHWCADDDVILLSDEDDNGVHIELNFTAIYEAQGER